MHVLDRLLRRVADLSARTPGNLLLAEHRRTALESALASVRPRAERLVPALDDGSAEAREQLAELAEEALRDMRSRVGTAAGRYPLRGLARTVDAWWSGPTEGEYIDDPTLDEQLRARAMRDLDDVNDALDSYPRFLDTMRPLLAPDRPTRILDLAAGHGGFMLALARIANAEGLALELTATDVMREYLDLGAAAADAEGLEVAFAVQDALDLSNLGTDDYDLIVCTQSIHHFPPGLVAVMFEEAARKATRGVVFLDGCRSVLKAVPLVAYTLTRFGNRVLAHDAYVSFRRFFVPEELELLARIGPWGDGVEARWTRPDHCLLRMQLADRPAA